MSRVLVIGVSAAAVGALALTACGGGGSKTAAEVRITNGDPDHVCYWDASVSKDGTRLLFRQGVNAYGGEIWVETLQGSTATGMRKQLAGRMQGTSPVFVGADRIAFLSSDSTSEGRLVVASLQGANRRTIPTVDKPVDVIATPDGKWLLYTVLLRKGEALHRVRVDGTGDQQILTDTWSVDGPVVSPDGTKIAYGRQHILANDDVLGEVWTARIDGSEPTKVAEGASPIWSPDGKRLAVIAPAGKASDGLPLEQVVVVSATGSSPVAITNSRSVKTGPLVWFKNNQIAYLYGSATADYCQLFAAQAPTAS